MVSNALKALIILIMSSSLSGCLILMFTGPAELEPTHRNVSSLKRVINNPKARVYTMRGLCDIFSTGMNSLAKRVHKELGLSATVLSYSEEKRLSYFLIKEYQSGRYRGDIILIGHSYGADEQITVAKRLNQQYVPVRLLIALDLTEKQTIPPNVETFYNISSGKSVFSGIIPWGAPLVAESKKTQVINVNLAKDKGVRMIHHFNIDKLTSVQTYIISIIQSSIVKQGLSKTHP